MRITGGIYRGRRIICPPGEIRPAMDRMRESLFSILGDISGAPFLDLFSGSGLVGIEAASRSAEPVHLVELDRQKKVTILQNIAFVESPIKLFTTDVIKFLRTAKERYAIIYDDPPFDYPNKVGLADLVNKRNLLEPNGLFVIHYPAEEGKLWPDSFATLIFVDERKYGRSRLRFYRQEGKNENS